MEPLLLKPTKTTPLVWFEPTAGTCIISGQSLPENAAEFYGRLIAALDEQLPATTAPVKWEFRLAYFNTSSTKGLYQVLARIKAHKDQGGDHTILWDIEDDDEFMREAGENFEELLGLGIEFKELSEEAASEEFQRLSSAMEHRAN